MSKIVKSFKYLIAGILFLIGSAHFFAADKVLQMMPDFMPAPYFWIYLSGVAELVLGLGILLPKFRKWSAYLIIAMLIVYFPLHVLDLLKEQPAIGPKWVAVLRLPLQVVMIWMTWLISKDKSV